MRLRLGLLQDAAAIERQAAKEAAEAAAKKHKHTNMPTVKTEAQTKAEEKAIARAKKEAEKAESEAKPPAKPRIRPLSEAKAIEMGTNFISEAFLFGVGGGLIVFESWRSRRKENTRRDEVSDRLNDLEESEKAARRALVELEREVLRLRAKDAKEPHPDRRIIPRSVYEVEEREEREEEATTKNWLVRIANYITRRGGDPEAEAALATNSPGPAEEILIKSDRELDAKHKAIEAEAAAREKK